MNLFIYERNVFQKKYISLFIFLPFILLCEYGVTYKLNNGRLGDRIRTYAKSKWFAYILDCPFYYVPFTFSDSMMMHELETHMGPSIRQNKKIVALNNEQELVRYQNNQENILFETDYYKTITPELCRFSVEYPAYGNEIRKMTMPHSAMILLYPPPYAFSVAIHVRKGSNGDMPIGGQQLDDLSSSGGDLKKYADYHYPDKFLPDQFFINQIHLLSDLLENKPIFVFIFTDIANPQAIMDIYRARVNRPNISFDCRQVNNAHSHYVLQDFYSMAYLFDCLIRSPESNFSWAAQLIGNHKIVIYPKKCFWRANKVITEDIQMIFIDRSKNLYQEIPIDLVTTGTLKQFLGRE